MSSISTHVLGGIVVPDPPLVSKSLELARMHLLDEAYNHVIRSWLLGFATAYKMPSFASHDLEMHPIAAILDDMGWDVTGKFKTPNKRFEVDGANAARSFIHK